MLRMSGVVLHACNHRAWELRQEVQEWAALSQKKERKSSINSKNDLSCHTPFIYVWICHLIWAKVVYYNLEWTGLVQQL
jgi:hypothetical protein